MPLEDLTGLDKFVGNLVKTNPLGSDDISSGDDHVRGIKNVLQNQFGTATNGDLALPRDVTVAGDLVVSGQLSGLGGSNLIHNPEFLVNQKDSDTYTSLAANTLIFDRYFWGVNTSTGTFTVERLGAGGPGGNINTWLKATCTTADTAGNSLSIQRLEHRFEGLNFSQQVMSDAVAGSNAVYITGKVIAHADAVSSITFPAVLGAALVWNGGAIRSFAFDIPIAADGVWQDFSVAIPADSLAQLVNDNAIAAWLRITPLAGSGRTAAPGIWAAVDAQGSSQGDNWCDAVANYIGVTNLGLMVSDVAVNPIRRGFQEELRICQRYYEKFEGEDNNYFLDGWSITTEIGSGNLQYQTKRDVPTLEADPLDFQISRPGAADTGVNAISVNGPTVRSSRLNVTTNATTQVVGDSFSLRGNATPCSFSLAAEL